MADVLYTYFQTKSKLGFDILSHSSGHIGTALVHCHLLDPRGGDMLTAMDYS